MEHISNQLTAMAQNLEPVRQDLRPSVISDEKNLAAALQEPRLCQLSDLEPLREALRLSMLMVGLRGSNVPQNEEKGILMSFIVNNYGGHTASEIKLAFTMAVNGSLGLDQKEVVCYENFSILYFSGIMNAYREWAKEAVKYVPKKETKLLPVSEVPDAEFIEGVKKMYLTSRDYKTIPVLAYKILEPEMNLTSEDKKRIYQYIHETTKEGDIKELSKQKAVAEYFDKL
jgi:hypothetical protein